MLQRAAQQKRSFSRLYFSIFPPSPEISHEENVRDEAEAGNQGVKPLGDGNDGSCGEGTGSRIKQES